MRIVASKLNSRIAEVQAGVQAQHESCKLSWQVEVHVLCDADELLDMEALDSLRAWAGTKTAITFYFIGDKENRQKYDFFTDQYRASCKPDYRRAYHKQRSLWRHKYASHPLFSELDLDQREAVLDFFGLMTPKSVDDLSMSGHRNLSGDQLSDDISYNLRFVICMPSARPEALKQAVLLAPEVGLDAESVIDLTSGVVFAPSEKLMAGTKPAVSTSSTDDMFGMPFFDVSRLELPIDVLSKMVVESNKIAAKLCSGALRQDQLRSVIDKTARTISESSKSESSTLSAPGQWRLGDDPWAMSAFKPKLFSADESISSSSSSSTSAVNTRGGMHSFENDPFDPFDSDTTDSASYDPATSSSNENSPSKTALNASFNQRGGSMVAIGKRLFESSVTSKLSSSPSSFFVDSVNEPNAADLSLYRTPCPSPTPGIAKQPTPGPTSVIAMRPRSGSPRQ